jgi:hypothetical protein
MDPYEQNFLKDLHSWQRKMQYHPSLFNRMTKRMQDKINNIIPEKVHNAITVAIKQMVRAVLFGAGVTTSKPLLSTSLEVREARIMERIEFFKRTAAAEGGLTGAGGFFLTLADFPLLLAIKMKMLFEIASLYGIDTGDYKERIYILYIFQLAFSSQQKRKEVYLQMVNWEEQKHHFPDDIHEYDWRSFQQEYRDYIDLAKLAQFIPVIGAAVGLVVNYRLLKKLGVTAMNAYRMRWVEQPYSAFPTKEHGSAN